MPDAFRHGLCRLARHRGRAAERNCSTCPPRPRRRSPCCAPRRLPAPSAPAATSCKAHQQEDFERVIEVFKAHDVGYFFYNGGNDSMDTAHKVAQLAAESRVWTWSATGVPKTIDNDVGDSEFKLIDHTPGYGSVARYWALNVQNANEENARLLPGRPGAGDAGDGAQDRLHPRRRAPGRPRPRDAAADLYARVGPRRWRNWPTRSTIMLASAGGPLVVVSEGFDVGDIGERKDSFGHTDVLRQRDDRGADRGQLSQRGRAWRRAARRGATCPAPTSAHNMIYASTVDLEEAYKVGQKAVRDRGEEGSGYMATILREPGRIYSVRYDKVPLEAGRQLGAVASPRTGSRHRAPTSPTTSCATPPADRRRLAQHPAGGGTAALCPARADLRRRQAARILASGIQGVSACGHGSSTARYWLGWRCRCRRSLLPQT